MKCVPCIHIWTDTFLILQHFRKNRMNFYSAYLTILECLRYGVHSVIHMQSWSMAYGADRFQINCTYEKQSLSMCSTWFTWKSKACFEAERAFFSAMFYPEFLQTGITKAKITTDAAEDHWSHKDVPTHSTARLIHTLTWDVNLHLWNSVQHWWVSTRQYNPCSLRMYSMYHMCPEGERPSSSSFTINNMAWQILSSVSNHVKLEKDTYKHGTFSP